MVTRVHSPAVMGILNVTQDSFWDGGKYSMPEQALLRAKAIQEEGADILDIGAESTRPGSHPIDLAEERSRLIPVLEKIIPAISIPICVDTTKSAVAQEALSMGAKIINDTSALADPAMAPIVAKAKASIILMHRKGPSVSMQRRPTYRNCVMEIKQYLKDRIHLAQQAGIPKRRILVDPGIGFGKKLEHNLEILSKIDTFCALGCPVVVGISRKSFLGLLLDAPVEQRLAGSLAAAIVAALRGAKVLRVHDVRETVHALKVLEALDALKLNRKMGTVLFLSDKLNTRGVKGTVPIFL